MKILVLNHADVLRLLPMEECVTLMREALIALADEKIYQPLRTMIRPPGALGIMGLMPAYAPGTTSGFGLKVICVFPGNPANGLDAHQGAVLLFSASTGQILAIIDASAITAIRTAAVSAVATQILARADAKDLAIIGAGVQARSHLAAMALARPIRRCRVASRSFDDARRFAAEMQPLYEFEAEPVQTVEAALAGADLIVTTTSASSPVLRRNWIMPGAHLNVVGASTPRAREVDGATVAAASLFVDSRESAVNEAGDYLLAVEEGAIGADHIRAEIGEVLKGTASGRTAPEEITLFKSVGLAAEDLASAQYVYARALETGAGVRVEFG